MNKVLISISVMSAVFSTNVFAGQMASPDAAHPITLEFPLTHHNGEDFRSLKICQDGSCRQLGPSSEYPVNWLNQQITQQYLRTGYAVGGAPLAGMAAMYSLPFGVGAAVTAVVSGGVTSGTIALAAVTAGTVAPSLISKSMNPHEQYKRLEAVKSAAKGDRISFKTNKETLKFSGQLEGVLAHYNQLPLRTRIANEVKSAWNGAVDFQKTLSAVPKGDPDALKALSIDAAN